MSAIRTWVPDSFEWDDSEQVKYSRSDYTIFNGDCNDFYGDIEDGSVDLLLTDPPYGMTDNVWDTKEFRDTLEKTWEHWLRIVKINGAIVVTACSPFDKIMAASQISLFRYEWIWHKNKPGNFLNANKMPMRSHENILVFYGKLPTYNAQKTTGHAPMPSKKSRVLKSTNYRTAFSYGVAGGSTLRYPRTVINIPVVSNLKNQHPTQKPLKLMELLVRTYTNEGETVIDPFMGSGTTGVAALRCGRKFIGVEANEEYFRGAKTRIECGLPRSGGGNSACQTSNL